MRGVDLVAALELERFVVTRRSASFVWLARGALTLLLNEAVDVPDDVALRILAEARAVDPP